MVQPHATRRENDRGRSSDRLAAPVPQPDAATGDVEPHDTRDLRVLFVSTQMEAGGVQSAAADMVRALRERGIEASLLFLYTKRRHFEHEQAISSLLDRAPRTPFDYFTIVSRLFSRVRRVRPTAIVGMAHYSSPLAAIAGVLFGVPRRIGTQTSQHDRLNIVARGLDWFCGTFGLYTANIAVARATYDGFSRHPARYRAALRIVGNGIKWTPSSLSKAEARAGFNLPGNVDLIVNCGRLNPVKNQAFLLDVLARLPDAHLAILGDGELRTDLERRIAELGLGGRVHLVGEVPRQRVSDFLRCGDVFAFPSHSEANSLALIEAMLSSLPIVASTHPAVRESLGAAGTALATDEARAWADEIGRLIDDTDYRADQSARSLKRSRAFGFEAMLAGFLACMR